MNKQKRFARLPKIFKLKTTILCFTLVVFCFILAPPALATTADPYGLQYGTATGLSSQDIRVSIMNIVRVILGFVGVIAILIIIYGGWLWMSSAGNPEQIDKAKKTLRNAAIGLVIIFSAFSIVSFIIGMLQGGFGTPGYPGGPPPPPGCDGCEYLGGGVIESVYPAPLAKDVARNTPIIVTFKEEMNPETIIADLSAGTTCSSVAPCTGTLAADEALPNVRIYKRVEGELATTVLVATAVNVISIDMKTYTFRPISPLGDSTTKHWYTTKLTDNITRDNDDTPAFQEFSPYFSWDFEIGTYLDLTPPKESSVFPPPDNEADDYTATVGVKAQGSITVLKQPNITQAAVAELETWCNNNIDDDEENGTDYDGAETGDPDESCEGSSDITAEGDSTTAIVALFGNYNGTYRGKLQLTVVESGTAAASWDPSNPSLPESYPISASDNINIMGLSVAFQDNNYASGNKIFWINLEPKAESDTLQVSNRIYRFVAEGANTGTNEINIVGTPGSGFNTAPLAINVATKINTQTQSPDMDANNLAGGIVELTAALAGTAGNYINVAWTGNWAALPKPMSGGSDESVAAIPEDQRDQPRNSIIRIDFNEPILPAVASGEAITDNAVLAGVGNLDPDDFNIIKVQVDLNENGFEDDEYVAGKFRLSNSYKTVEFIPTNPCPGATTNTCGDPIFCLPVNDENWVKYKVTIRAAELKTCADSAACDGLGYENGLLTEECVDLGGGLSPSPVCGNVDGTLYMRAGEPATGIADLALNSFDGNKNSYSAGPEGQSGTSPYYLNTPVTATGDDLEWTFFIRNKIDLDGPVIVGIEPSINGAGESLTAPIQATFNKLLQSSTVKPDSGYVDGLCTCDSSPCSDPDQVCLNNFCVNQTRSQNYCGEDSQCESNDCKVKKYVSLIDRTTRPVAWWIGNYGQDIQMCLNDDYLYKECGSDDNCGGDADTCSLKDGYTDRSIVQIKHTRLLDATQYGAEVASGVRDIYQNCFNPGAGPDVSSTTCEPISGDGCCGISPNQAYCCDGVNQGTPCDYVF